MSPPAARPAGEAVLMRLRGRTGGRRVGLMRSAIVASALAIMAVLMGAPAALAQSCLPPPPPPCGCDQMPLPPPQDPSPPIDPGSGSGPPDQGPPPPAFAAFGATGISDETITEATPPPDAKFKIDIGGPADNSVTISYRTVDGTATAGEDYVATSGEVKIDQCESKASFKVPILDDAMDEPDQTFTVELGGDESGTATGTIVDDDAPPTMSVGNASVVEGTGGGSTAQFPGTLSAPSGFTITATYTTVSQTASAGSDFQPETGTVSFPPGMTTQTISVPIVADNANEGDETFGIDISAPQDVTIATPQAVATIRNDDQGAPSGGVPHQNPPEPPVIPLRPPQIDTLPPAIAITPPVQRNGVVEWTVSCPASEKTCAGTVTVTTLRAVTGARASMAKKRKKVNLGSTSYRLNGGDSKKVRVRINQRGRKLVRRKHNLPVKATFKTRDGSGNKSTRTQTFTLHEVACRHN